MIYTSPMALREPSVECYIKVWQYTCIVLGMKLVDLLITRALYIKYLTILLTKSFWFHVTFGWTPNFTPKVNFLRGSQTSPSTSKLIDSVDEALEYSNRHTNFPAPRMIRFTDGMSGQSFRAFLYKLSDSLGEFEYLEIGVWKGSTAKCVLCSGKVSATLIDNWSQFGGPKAKAIKKLDRFISSKKARILDQDFLDIAYNEIDLRPLVYFYDGPHDEISHFKSAELIKWFKSKLLIFIVDDWNWANVQNGTLEALARIQAEIVASWEIFPNMRDRKGGRFSRWHNGTYIAIIRIA